MLIVDRTIHPNFKAVLSEQRKLRKKDLKDFHPYLSRTKLGFNRNFVFDLAEPEALDKFDFTKQEHIAVIFNLINMDREKWTEFLVFFDRLLRKFCREANGKAKLVPFFSSPERRDASWLTATSGFSKFVGITKDYAQRLVEEIPKIKRSLDEGYEKVRTWINSPIGFHFAHGGNRFVSVFLGNGSHFYRNRKQKTNNTTKLFDIMLGRF